MSAPARHGEEALAKIDAVLAARPHKDDLALAQAVKALCALRDGMIEEGEAGAASRERLEHANAVIAVVVGVHFPIGETPWDELGKARGWLAGLVS